MYVSKNHMVPHTHVQFLQVYVYTSHTYTDTHIQSFLSERAIMKEIPSDEDGHLFSFQRSNLSQIENVMRSVMLL
jgi:hypothetical protein